MVKSSTSTISVGADVGKTSTSTQTLSFNFSSIPVDAVVTKVVVNMGKLTNKGTFKDMKVNLTSDNAGTKTVSWNGAGNSNITFDNEFTGVKARGTYKLTLTGTCSTGYYMGGINTGYGSYQYGGATVTVYYNY